MVTWKLAQSVHLGKATPCPLVLANIKNHQHGLDQCLSLTDACRNEPSLLDSALSRLRLSKYMTQGLVSSQGMKMAKLCLPSLGTGESMVKESIRPLSTPQANNKI